MPERQSRGEFLVLMAAASATIAIAIDAMLPAFSDVREHFGLDPTSSDAALIITVFMIGLGFGQMIYGPLADRFGRKPVFFAGLLLYVVAGFATSAATSLDALLIGRFIWGLGAAGPRVVTQAMLRDRFSGDDLARAMAIVLTVFLVIPTIAPALGQAALALGSWRYAFAVGPVFATVVALWSFRVSESLDPSDRRSLDVRAIGRAVLTVLRTRAAVGNMIALMLLTAAFFPYLASSERMYGEIYGRDDDFYLFFAATSIVMAAFILTSTRLVSRLGARRTGLGLSVLLVMAAGGNLLLTVGFSGVPAFWLFFAGTTVVVSLNTALTPILTSQALDEVGHIAGTAASTIGMIGFVGGSTLSSIVDRAIDLTVTPFAAWTLVFALLSAVASMAARPGNRSVMADVSEV